MAFLGEAAAYVGSFFVSDAAAAGAGTAAAEAGGLETVTVTAGSAAGTAAGAGAGTAAAVGGAGAAAGAAAAASNTPKPTSAPPAQSKSIATTVAEASAVAEGASALTTLANGPGRINVPPSPSGVGSDQAVVDAEQKELQRRQAAGGLASTAGTPGGQAGAVLNPSTISNKSLLGA
jgi:hypothetical protein